MKQNRFSNCYPALLILFLSSLWLQSLAQQDPAIVYFASGKSDLNRNAQETLNAFGNILPTDQHCKAIIYGHTDSDGSLLSNQVLSQQRCESVMAYLVDQGWPSDRIAIAGFGELRPADDNHSDKGKQANRRVEIHLECETVAEPIPMDEAIDDNNLDELFADLRGEPQKFFIHADKDTVISCAQGSKLIFTANSLKTVDNTPVEIRVYEVFDKSQMVLQNMCTAYDRSVLVSGGMLDVTAYQNGQPVKLRPGSSYTSMVPTDEMDPRMELFDGKRLNARNKPMRWKQRSVSNFNGMPTFDVLNCKRYYPVQVKCGFFCRMRSALSADYRRYKKSQGRVRNPNCKTTRELKKQYGVKTVNQLYDALLKEEFAKYQVDNIEDYWTAVAERQRQAAELAAAQAEENRRAYNEKMEASLQDGSLNAQESGYYMFSNTGFMPVNCDYFLREEPEKLLVVRVPNDEKEAAYCSLVFESKNIVMSSIDQYSSFLFKNVPRGEKATIVCIKKVEGDYFLSMQDINAGDKEPAPAYEKVSLDELKYRLGIVDEPKSKDLVGENTVGSN
ncbi:MAG: OmpA family protein [Flavobacteriales bacterium]|nr:OmpA family protein [Flavobacteriales bacterium]